MVDALRALADSLASLFAGEARPGGDRAADALMRHRDDPLALAPRGSPLAPEIRALCHAREAPEAARLADAASEHLHWFHAGLEDGAIPEGVARRMLTCELLGPNGTIRSNICRLGLFAQLPGTDYELRSHAAEETFIMLAGQGDWRVEPHDWVTLGPGGISHHPSMIPHASRASGRAFLTAWRWTGDIGVESYQYLSGEAGPRGLSSMQTAPD